MFFLMNTMDPWSPSTVAVMTYCCAYFNSTQPIIFKILYSSSIYVFNLPMANVKNKTNSLLHPANTYPIVPGNCMDMVLNLMMMKNFVVSGTVVVDCVLGCVRCVGKYYLNCHRYQNQLKMNKFKEI